MKWNNDYMLRVIAGEYVLLPVAGEAAKSCELVALNRTAGEICALLSAGVPAENLAAQMAAEYEISAAELAEDVNGVLAFLREKHILID